MTLTLVFICAAASIATNQRLHQHRQSTGTVIKTTFPFIRLTAMEALCVGTRHGKGQRHAFRAFVTRNTAAIFA